jgi:hypothetical protein
VSNYKKGAACNNHERHADQYDWKNDMVAIGARSNAQVERIVCLIFGRKHKHVLGVVNHAAHQKLVALTLCNSAFAACLLQVTKRFDRRLLVHQQWTR